MKEVSSDKSSERKDDGSYEENPYFGVEKMVKT